MDMLSSLEPPVSLHGKSTFGICLNKGECYQNCFFFSRKSFIYFWVNSNQALGHFLCIFSVANFALASQRKEFVFIQTKGFYFMIDLILNRLWYT